MEKSAPNVERIVAPAARNLPMMQCIYRLGIWCGHDCVRENGYKTGMKICCYCAFKTKTFPMVQTAWMAEAVYTYCAILLA